MQRGALSYLHCAVHKFARLCSAINYKEISGVHTSTLMLHSRQTSYYIKGKPTQSALSVYPSIGQHKVQPDTVVHSGGKALPLCSAAHQSSFKSSAVFFSAKIYLVKSKEKNRAAQSGTKHTVHTVRINWGRSIQQSALLQYSAVHCAVRINWG